MIGSIGGIGISSYILTRTSLRDGETPPVEAIDPVESPQDQTNEIDWTQTTSMFSSGAVMQRLSILLAREAMQSQFGSDPESPRQSVENAARLRVRNRPETEGASEDGLRQDPTSRLVDVVSERAKAMVSSPLWTSRQMAVLAETIQQFRGDVRQAAQSFDSRKTRSDELIERIEDAFERLNRSLQTDPDSSKEGEAEPIFNVEDALTDSPIPPNTLRAAFAVELANLRMTLSEPNAAGRLHPQSAGDNLYIEQYRAMERQRLEQWRADLYQPQVNAVA